MLNNSGIPSHNYIHWLSMHTKTLLSHLALMPWKEANANYISTFISHARFDISAISLII